LGSQARICIWETKNPDQRERGTFITIGLHKHRIAEIHAISMKRLSKIEAADDPSDGADDE
jgi:hypothetical protein